MSCVSERADIPQLPLPSREWVTVYLDTPPGVSVSTNSSVQIKHLDKEIKIMSRVHILRATFTQFSHASLRHVLRAGLATKVEVVLLLSTERSATLLPLPPAFYKVQYGP